MKDFRYSFLTTIPSLRLGLNNPRNINRGASVKLASSLRLLRSFHITWQIDIYQCEFSSPSSHTPSKPINPCPLKTLFIWNVSLFHTQRSPPVELMEGFISHQNSISPHKAKHNSLLITFFFVSCRNNNFTFSLLINCHTHFIFNRPQDPLY